MGAQTPGGMARNVQVATEQTQRNLRPGAQAEMRAREGFQQRGPAFERLMQDQAFQQRFTDEQLRRGRNIQRDMQQERAMQQRPRGPLG